MLEIIILALALSMDAFAVSVGLGSKPQLPPFNLALKAGLYFGASQGLMPLIGYLCGKGAMPWLGDYAHWLAFVLLALIGGKMIYEAFSDGIENDICVITHRIMGLLAIATSIDAIAAGFSLHLLDVHLALACLTIAFTTAALSVFGVYVGRVCGVWLESKAEFLGGVTLILLGFKILLF
jgi:putative Mn2+ efflux pump MntP